MIGYLLIAGIGYGVAFWISSRGVAYWRSVVGFLLALVVGWLGGGLIVAGGFSLVSPEAATDVTLTLLGRGFWWAAVGAGFGVYRGRLRLNRTNSPAPVANPKPVAVSLRVPAAIEEFSTKTHVPVATPSIAFDENEAYKLIAEEIETGGMDKGLWLKAMVQTTGQDEKMQKIVYSQLRLEQLKAERAERTVAEAASNLAKEVPEFDELEAENYVPVGKQDFLGLTIRELANGLAAVETTRQQRCYKDISAAKSAIQEFRQDGRWTLKGLIVAIERSSAK